jgi:hypothetical protein
VIVLLYPALLEFSRETGHVEFRRVPHCVHQAADSARSDRKVTGNRADLDREKAIWYILLNNLKQRRKFL